MKKLAVLFMLVSASQTLMAQQAEGKIIFEEKIDVHRRLPKENEQMRAMIPQFRTNKFELLYADNKSLYRKVEEEADLSEQPQHGGGMVMRFGGADNIFYKDLTTQKTVEKRDLMEKEFLVEDSIKNLNWKLAEGETKTILGYVCKKATAKTERGNNLIAWYADDISISSGPGQFSGLPGMILALDMNEGEIIYTAIEKATVKKSEIKAPAKGKKVTPDEFAKIRKELMGDGPVRIVTN
jgi:GLPGLI family protein